MHKILNGIRRFQRNVFPHYEKAFQELASRQEPEALLITCSDSRVVPELFTQCGPGELFVYRNAGNIVPPFRAEDGSGTLATIEYAVSVLRVKSLIVCGHSDCGAMKGVLNPESVRNLPLVDKWLRQAECAKRIVCEHHRGVAESDKLQLLTQENVIAQLESVRTHPSVAVALARNELELFGLYYDISTGEVTAFDQSSGTFVALQDLVPPAGPRRGIGEHRKAA